MRLKELYTIKEVAQALKCSADSVRTYYKEGRIRTIMIGKRYKVREEEMQYVLAHGLREPTASFRKVSRERRRVSRERAKAREAAALKGKGGAE